MWCARFLGYHRLFAECTQHGANYRAWKWTFWHLSDAKFILVDFKFEAPSVLLPPPSLSPPPLPPSLLLKRPINLVPYRGMYLVSPIACATRPLNVRIIISHFQHGKRIVRQNIWRAKTKWKMDDNKKKKKNTRSTERIKINTKPGQYTTAQRHTFLINMKMRRFYKRDLIQFNDSNFLPFHYRFCHVCN